MLNAAGLTELSTDVLQLQWRCLRVAGPVLERSAPRD